LCLGADSGQKYEDFVQKYRHRLCLEDTAHASNNSKPNKQPKSLARPVPSRHNPCHHHNTPFAAFAFPISYLF